MDVPIPRRMAHLPRDPRGYPIPAMALIDEHGRAHFTINDEVKRQKLLKEDRCPICGSRIIGGRWFVGGPLSAFHQDGRYLDPPTHDECAHYALRACPYLAAPTYSGRIDDRTLRPENQTIIMVDQTMIPERPEVFVAVLARTHKATAGLQYLMPTRPYMRVEFWRHGERLEDAEGWAIIKRVTAQPIPPRQAPRILIR